MVLLADVGGVGGVVSTLTSIAVPPDVINDIVSILTSESSTLANGMIPPVNEAWFGDRPSGTNLATHTHKAHEKMANSVLEAVASLQETGDAMKQWDKEISDVDVDSSVATTTLLNRTQRALDHMDDDRSTPPLGADE